MSDAVILSERALIGCLLNACREATLISVRENIRPDSFSVAAYSAIYALVCDGARNGCVPDVAMISQRIDADSLEKIGGLIGLNRIVDDACIEPHAAYHAKIVRDAHLARRSAATFTRLALQMKQSKEPDKDLAAAQAELHSLMVAGVTSNTIRHVSDFAQEKVEQWRSALGRGFVGLPSTFSELNRYLGGYRPGVMCVLGGFRGEGKSTISRQEALGLARKGYKVLLCSLEDPGDIAAAGIAGNNASRSVFHLDVGESGQGDIDRIEIEWQDMRNLPLHIASGAMRIEDIENAAMIHAARFGLDFIIIDHIQFITPYKLPGMDRNGTVATYSQRIVGMLAKHKIPGLVLSQLSRDSEKESRKPRLSDLRDSGCIEQDARQVMLLYYNAGDEHHRLEIAKNNFGISSRTFKMKREDGLQRFRLLEEEKKCQQS